jgi:hypothetical protein
VITVAYIRELLCRRPRRRELFFVRRPHRCELFFVPRAILRCFD